MLAPSVLLISLLAYVVGTNAIPTLLSARDNSTCSSSGALCNTGTVSCCQTIYPSNSSALSKITSALNIPLDPVQGFVGMGCSPLSVIGPGSGAVCTQESVCCSGNTYYGLINIGCTAINIYL
ncbi:fungal hydrophobin [Rhizopogon vinicolor AM-OR11-026]|uniref:Hydrophobin n=1 Tax=Rhizopogon vinicolor AM-OR11-026 TaxID=1314800 RepID=A0A1B7N4P9_9AGAM|nr:fungal hydrophobin [Rhizopogon vinicolor AM-OR11-026]